MNEARWLASIDPQNWSLATTIMAFLICLLLCAFFSAAETAMMSLNRYRLRHLVKERHRGARKANHLLRRPDRLLGVILFGNNLVNFSAATIATYIGHQAGIPDFVMVMLVTAVFLIFGEIGPKTLAAQIPERIAFPSAHALEPLLRVLYPVVWLLNATTNAIWRIVPTGRAQGDHHDRLTPDELRTVVRQGATLPQHRQNMMLGILDLDRVTVNDIMVPRADVVGINLDDEISQIIETLSTGQHTRLPVYKGNVNSVVGFLHLRNAARFLTMPEPTKAALLQQTSEAYFVPEGTPLHTQLFNFQKHQGRIALVVNEYGDVQGIVTLEDILEEIVGKFTTDFAADNSEIKRQSDGSCIIDGSALLRDINRALGWRLPIVGPRTLNGLVLEYLEFIPEANLCLQIDGYRFEVLAIKENALRSVRVTERPRHIDLDDLDNYDLDNDDLGEH